MTYDTFNDHWKENPETGCWDWTGRLNGEGKYHRYGKLWFDGRQVLAHRHSYERSVGPIPPGMVVMHRCDNPLCVKPDHLRVGTVADNNRDRARKERSWRPKGSLSGKAKLTDDEVASIRKLYGSGEVTQRQLGERFNISQRTIGRIVRDEAWQ